MLQPALSFQEVWPKENMVKLILTFSKIVRKRQYGSLHAVFQENFEQKIIWFNPYCLFRKF